MHIVFIAGTYYPRFSAVARCAKNLVDVMNRKHDVTVIARRCWDSPAEPKNLNLQENLVYVATKLESARCKVESWQNSGSASKVWRAADRMLAALHYGETVFSCTSCRQSEVRTFLCALESLGKKPDQLIPVSLPFEGVVACAIYKQRHPEVVLTPILFDQFSESATLLKTGLERRVKFKASLELERMVVETSDRIFTVTWDDHVQKHFPDLASKFSHIEHPMLVRDKDFDVVGDSIFGTGVHAVYAGALNVCVRDPKLLINLFEGFSLREGFPLKLHTYAVGDGVSIVREAQERCPDDIEVCDPVEPAELLPIYASADLLVSVGNDVSDQKPSKITEYMATGKPIVHVSRCDDDPVIPDLERYPLGLVLCSSADPKENQDKLAAFLKRVRGKRAPFQEIAALFPSEVPENVCDLIVSGGGGLCLPGIFRAW